MNIASGIINLKSLIYQNACNKVHYLSAIAKRMGIPMNMKIMNKNNPKIKQVGTKYRLDFGGGFRETPLLLTGKFLSHTVMIAFLAPSHFPGPTSLYW